MPSFELRSLIAQTLLKREGFYAGILDGEWGPMSKEAAANWDAARGATDVSSPGAQSPYDLARHYIGEKEIPGAKNNNLIVRWGRRLATWFADDETAWCSAFVNAMADDTGYERSGKLNARSWLDVGVEVPPEKARQGDVVIFWRGVRDGWEGHVGFVVSRDGRNKTVRVLGGNQNDSICIETFSERQLLGYRRLRPLTQLQGSTSKLV